MSPVSAGSAPQLSIEGDAGLLDAIIDGTAYPVVVFDVYDGGRFVVACVNDAAVSSGRILTAQWRGRNASEALPPDALEALVDGYTECLRIGGTYSYEEFVVIAGRETWWMTTLVPSFDAEGRPNRLVASHLPAEFVRRAEDALRRSEANFTRLNERSLDPSFIVEPEGRVLYANPAAAKLLDQPSAASLVGTSLESFMAPEAQAGMDRLIAGAIAGAASAPIELRLVPASGRPVVVEATPIRIEFEGAASVLVLARDVSEVRTMQAQLAFADRMAALGRMAAGVAHEVNNPLAYAHGNLQFAVAELARVVEDVASGRQGIADAASCKSDVDLADVLSALKESLDGLGRVRSIVRDLKGLSTFDDAQPGPSNVAAALEAAIKLAEREIRGRARLERDLTDVPRVGASEPRLVQVFLNLLVNAAQAIVEGSPEDNVIRVATRSEERKAEAGTGFAKNNVIVEVTDTGGGIGADDRDKLFDPFYTTKPAGSGTGLGLSICQQIVRAAGGSIEVDSELGRGSTFRVVLPVAEMTPVEVIAVEQQASRIRSRILLVDDEPAVGRSIARLLGRVHEVTVETKAAAAVEKLRGDAAFDVILCDLMMPQMDGSQFFGEVEKFAPHLAERIVFLSGGVFTPGVRTFLDRVKNECLEKPADIKALLAAIERTRDKRAEVP